MRSYKVTYYKLYTLARLFNSQWHDSSTVAGTIVQQSLTRLFNSFWHDCSTVADTIVQQSLARLLNSGWHDSTTVTGTIITIIILYSNKWIRGDFTKSHITNYIHWQDCSTVTGTIIQQWLARFFDSHWHNSSTVTGTIL